MAIVVDFQQRSLRWHRPAASVALMHQFGAVVIPERPLLQHSFIIDGCIRLTNSSELASMLGLPVNEVDAWTLLQAAYQYWGTEVAARLRGDWWFAAWDASRNAVVLLVDPTSPTSLFYAWTRDHRLAFAPAVADLLALPEVSAELDEARLLSYMADWIDYDDVQQTEYRAIRQVCPGTIMLFNGKTETSTTYWHPTQFQANTRLSQQDYVAELLHRYRLAVSSRVQAGTVATTLSAGLDSASLTALTAEALQRQGRSFTAFTHVPVSAAVNLTLQGKLVNEWPLAALLAATQPNIRHQAIQSEHTSPIAAAANLITRSGRWQAGNSNAHWISQLYSQAQVDGTDVLLIGQFGNIVLSNAGEIGNFWRLLPQFGLTQTWKHLGFSQQSWPRVFRSGARDAWRLFHPAMPSANFMAQLSWGAAPALILQWRDQFAQQAAQFQPSGFYQTRNQRFAMLVIAASINQQLSNSFQLRVADPTSDQNVVEWCLQVPNRQFYDQGQHRLLLRRAMQGLLPDAIRLNTVRGAQDADLALRLSQHQSDITLVLQQMEKSALVNHYLDVAKIAACHPSVPTTMNPDTRCGNLHKGLQMGLFLLSTEKNPLVNDLALSVS